MFSKKPLSIAVSAATMALAGSAYSSITLAEEEELIEEVVVTGSRIQRAVSDAPSPVTVINSEDLELSGLGCVEKHNLQLIRVF